MSRQRRENNTDNSRLVYSTELDQSDQRKSKQVFGTKSRLSPANDNDDMGHSKDNTIRLWRETKGRKGKGVTMVSGIPGTAEEMKNLAKEIKQLCGAGGTVKAGVIEIQGDRCDVLMPFFEKRGFKVRRVGG